MGESSAGVQASLVLGAGLGLLFALGGCESERSVGSTCPGGVCRESASSTAELVPCLLGSMSFEVPIPFGLTGPELRLCLPHAQRVGKDGLVDCQLLATIDADGPSCESLGFVESEAPSTRVGARDCVVPQIPASSGSPSDPNAVGFAYDTSDAVHETCPFNQQRIVFTDALVFPEDAVAQLHCEQALADPEIAAPALGLTSELVPVERDACLAPPAADARGVGEPCMPFVEPDGGFDDRVVYVQTGADDCESDVCMVYLLRGSAADDCVTELPTESSPGRACATEDEVDARVYCSCRCDDGQGGGCACPDGFSCVDALATTSGSAAGGYCVRNGTSL